MEYINIINKKFSKLLVIERVPAPEHIVNKQSTYYRCLCECGKETIVIGADLRGGHTTSCGCGRIKKLLIIIGCKFNKLTVIKLVKAPITLSKGSKKSLYFLCKCDCGKETIVRSSSLRTNKTKSCGCSLDFIDLAGQKFGKLTVIKRYSTPKHIVEKNRAYFLCECECGIKKTISGKELRNGNRTSCGCSKKHITKDTPRLASAKTVYNRYKDGDMSFDQFMILSQLKCTYCNAEPSNLSNIFKNRKKCTDFSKLHGNFIYNGLDRINSKLPHNINNITPCCIKCNVMKLHRSVDEFKLQILKIYNFYIKKDNK